MIFLLELQCDTCNRSLGCVKRTCDLDQDHCMVESHTEKHGVSTKTLWTKGCTKSAFCGDHFNSTCMNRQYTDCHTNCSASNNIQIPNTSSGNDNRHSFDII